MLHLVWLKLRDFKDWILHISIFINSFVYLLFIPTAAPLPPLLPDPLPTHFLFPFSSEQEPALTHHVSSGLSASSPAEARQGSSARTFTSQSLWIPPTRVPLFQACCSTPGYTEGEGPWPTLSHSGGFHPRHKDHLFPLSLSLAFEVQVRCCLL